MERVRTSDGLDIAVRDLGGSGPDIVFAHATGLVGSVWTPVAAALGDAFHCVAFDLRGHGDSGAPAEGDYDWRGFARDTLAAVEGLGAGADGVLGVGHSSGATALLLAEQARPGTFRALYCFEPIMVAADSEVGRERSAWLAAGARRRRETFGSREEAVANYSEKRPFVEWGPEALAAYVRDGLQDVPDGTVRLKCRRDDEALMYEAAASHDGYDRLGEVACPVLLASGADTDAVAAGSVAALAARLPRASTEVLPGVGHFGPLQDPAQVAGSIRSFFSTALRTGAT